MTDFFAGSARGRQRLRPLFYGYFHLPENSGKLHQLQLKWTAYLLVIKQIQHMESASMPAISMFYGLIIRMYFFDNDHHHKPHIHAEYQEFKAVFEIATGLIIAGNLPAKQTKLVTAWIEIHEDELFADWQLAVNGEPVFKIEPLR